jgi:hypothetical protein
LPSIPRTAGRPGGQCTIDWDSLAGVDTLRATTAIPRAQDASHDRLETPAVADERGRVLGANPIAILLPWHRVTRGREVPDEYVGGPEPAQGPAGRLSLSPA